MVRAERFGKQVFLDRIHLADGVDDQAAEFIVQMLNIPGSVELLDDAREALEMVVYIDPPPHPDDYSLQKAVIGRLRERLGMEPVIEAKR